jgi:hypothetical protein
MKFALFVDSYSVKPEDGGVSRKWYSHGDGIATVWASSFASARQMTIEDAVEVYRRVDSPLRKIGLAPVE